MISSLKIVLPKPGQQRGFSLIEVLVTIVILLVGLLGLAGLQGRALSAQMEAYQRSQALVLLKDMAARINANRALAANYRTTGLTPAYLGTDNAAVADCTAVAIGQARDFCEWNNVLLGAAETQAGGNRVGAMINARGCISQLSAGGAGIPSQYLIQVVWQGLNSTQAPAAALTCGENLYPNATTPIEALRRVVSLPISIANL